MHIVLGFFGMVASIAMMKYRSQIGDIMGDPDWMKYVGGVYNFVVIVAVIVFFWSIAYMTGTTNILFSPILMFIPHQSASVPGVIQ